jgi:hypothetical protein
VRDEDGVAAGGHGAGGLLELELIKHGDETAALH